MAVSYWWECEDCHEKFDFRKTIGCGIIRFLWIQITSGRDQPLLCAACGRASLRFTFEFAQSARRKSQRSKPAVIITSSLLIKGDICGCEDLYINGEVHGAIHLPDGRLTVGPNGKISADVDAREVIVRGNVEGTMRVHDRLEVASTGEVRGDVETPRFAFEDGAQIHAELEIKRPEEPQPAAAPAVKPAEAPERKTLAMKAGAGQPYHAPPN